VIKTIRQCSSNAGVCRLQFLCDGEQRQGLILNGSVLSDSPSYLIVRQRGTPQ